MDGARLLRLLAWVQGGFYVATGIWPLLSMTTFETVTGPKTDDWLVKTVGVLVLVIGAVLLAAAARRSFALETVLLAAGSALGLAAVDVVFVAQGTLSPIYLLDAAVEALSRSRGSRPTPTPARGAPGGARVARRAREILHRSPRVVDPT